MEHEHTWEVQEKPAYQETLVIKCANQIDCGAFVALYRNHVTINGIAPDKMHHCPVSYSTDQFGRLCVTIGDIEHGLPCTLAKAKVA